MLNLISNQRTANSNGNKITLYTHLTVELEMWLIPGGGEDVGLVTPCSAVEHADSVALLDGTLAVLSQLIWHSAPSF